jgi:phage pi2 protein 07
MDKNAYRQLINDYRDLFWYTPVDRKENLSEEQVVETLLNYGDEIAVKRLFDVLGIDRVAVIFYKQMAGNRRKNNYKELVSNYFQLYFRRHAKRDPDQ